MKTKIFTLILIFAFALSLSSYSQARLQAIHNSPDPLVSVVDVWLDTNLVLNDFAFREASPFVTVPSGVSFDLSIQPSNSTDTVNALAKFNYTLTANQTYILIANGLVNSTGYNDFKPFNIEVFAMGQETSPSSTATSVLAFHGSPDAPVIDLVETGQGAGTIIDNFTWASFVGYMDVLTANYVLEVRDSIGINTLATYQAPLVSLNLGGQAVVLVASGFLNPAVNNNGPSFGLFAALTTGGSMYPLPIITGLNETQHISQSLVYPNPANEVINLDFSLTEAGQFGVRIYDITGKEVFQRELGLLPSGPHFFQFPAQQLDKGRYLLVLEGASDRMARKIQIIR